jgi:hypothetical protein
MHQDEHRAVARASFAAVHEQLTESGTLRDDGKDFTAIELVGTGVEDWRVRVAGTIVATAEPSRRSS